MTLGGGSNRVTVRIVGDASQFKRETDKARDASTKLVDTLKKHAGAIKLFLAVQAARAIKNFVFDAKNAFSDLEQAIGGTDAVFGDNAEQIQDWAQTADQAVGLSKEAFNRLATIVGAQLQNMGFDLDESTEKTGVLIEVAADLAATYGGPVTKAIEAISSLLQGQSRPIRAYAINILDADKKNRALALGLLDANGEMSKQAKTIATLDLIMEQSSKARGQFAREAETIQGKELRLNAALENQKVLLGEAIAPLYLQMIGLANDLIPVIGILAGGFAELTGKIDLNRLATQAWLEEHGTIPKSGRDVVRALKEEVVARFGLSDAIFAGAAVNERLVESLLALITAGDLTETQLKSMKVGVRELADEGFLLFGQEEELTAAIERQIPFLHAQERAISDLERPLGALTTATTDLSGETDDATEAAEALAEAEGEQAEALDEAAEAVKRKRDALLEVHNPLFRITQLSRDLEEAELAVTEAENEFTRDSPEFVGAVMDRANVLFDLRTTFDELLMEGINPTGEAARNMFRGLGVPDDVIDKIFGVFDEIQTNLRDRLFSIDVRANFLGLTGPLPDPAHPRLTRHTGGRVNAPRGQEVLVRVLGGETFSNPAHSNGGDGGGTTVIVNGFVGSELALAAELDRLLTRRSRSSPLGFL